MISGNHAIGTVRKFPTLPLNPNGVWIDPTGGVWRQASNITTKEGIPEYSQVAGGTPQHPLPDYERLVKFLQFFSYVVHLKKKFNDPIDLPH